MMRTGPSFQRKGPGRGMPTLQLPNCKPSLLSKLILVPAIYSYLTTPFFTALMSSRRDTKTVISSANADTFAERDTAQGRTCLLIPKPTEQGLQSENIEKRRQYATRPDRTLNFKSLRALPVHLHYCLQVVVHHTNPFAELRLESGGLQNSCQEPMVNPIKDLGLIQIDQRSFSAVF